MPEEKKNVETEVVKEARELTAEELEQVTGGKEQLVASTDGDTYMITFNPSLYESSSELK